MEEVDDLEYTQDPLIIIKRIADERESKNKLLKSRIKHDEITLFGETTGRITKLKRAIEFDTDLKQLDECRETLYIIERIHNLIQTFFAVQTTDDDAFKNLFTICEDMFGGEQEKDNKLIQLEKEIKFKDEEIIKKEQEVQEKEREKNETVLLETHKYPEFIEVKAKQDAELNKFWERLKEEPEAISALRNLGKKQDKPKEEIPVPGDIKALLHAFSDTQRDRIIQLHYLKKLEKKYKILPGKLSTQTASADILATTPGTMSTITIPYNKYKEMPNFIEFMEEVVIKKEPEYDWIKLNALRFAKENKLYISGEEPDET